MDFFIKDSNFAEIELYMKGSKSIYETLCHKKRFTFLFNENNMFKRPISNTQILL